MALSNHMVLKYRIEAQGCISILLQKIWQWPSLVHKHMIRPTTFPSSTCPVSIFNSWRGLFFYGKALHTQEQLLREKLRLYHNHNLCQMAQQQIISCSYEHTFASVSSSAIPQFPAALSTSSVTLGNLRNRGFPGDGDTTGRKGLGRGCRCSRQNV